MHRLRTFGGLSLEAPEGVSLPRTATQRRRLALLVLLASADGRGISREKLACYLWPESDEEHAKNSLKQAVFALRRDLNAPDLFVGVTDLSLNPGAITSDVGDFRTALTEGDYPRAVSLYTGPFLDGVHIREAPGFEEWVEAERAELADTYHQALRTVAQRASVRGEWELAADYWYRLAAEVPFDSQVTVDLMRALWLIGQPDKALAQARVHQALVRQEFETEAHSAVAALAAEIRSAPAARRTAVIDSAELPSVEAPIAIDAPTAPNDLANGPPWLRRAVTYLFAVLVLVLSFVLLLRANWAAHSSMVTAPTLAVLPFTVRGPHAYDYLSEGMVDLLTRDLDQSGSLRTVDPNFVLSVSRAERRDATVPLSTAAPGRLIGARFLISGEVISEPPRLRVGASLVDESHRSVPLAQVSVEGDEEHLFELVDSLARKLLAAYPPLVGQGTRWDGIAAMTTSSLPALKEYLRGEGAYRAERFVEAVDAFQTAVHIDTAFSLAYYRLSIAADWAGTLPVALVRSSADAALRHASHLAAREQSLLRALVDWRDGQPDEAEHILRQTIAIYPGGMEAWYELGEVQFHAGPLRGHEVEESRAAFEHVSGLNPEEREARLHLLRLAALRRDTVAVDSLGKEAMSAASPNELRELRAFLAFATGNTEAQARSLVELHGADDQLLNTIVWRVAVYARNIAGAERIAALMMDAARGSPRRELAIWNLAHLELASGRWRSADSLFDQSRAGHSFEDRAFYAALPFRPVSDVTLRSLHDSLELLIRPLRTTAVGSDRALAANHSVFVFGLTSSRLKLRSDLEWSESWLRARADTSPIGLVMQQRAGVLRAQIALLEGAPDRARDALIEVREKSLSYAGEADAYQRYLLAEVYKELKQDSLATALYRTMGELFIPGLVFRAPSELREAEMCLRAGDKRRATLHYQRATALWQRADAPSRQSLKALAIRWSLAGQ